MTQVAHQEATSAVKGTTMASTANTWFVMIPPSYQNAPAAEKQLVDFVVQYPYGSPEWNAANSGQVVGGGTGLFGQVVLGEGTQQLVKWLGPFATQAAAKAAASPRQQSANPG